MISTDGLRRSEHYAHFHAHRTRTVRLQLMQTIDGVTSPVDVSAAKWQIRLRAYTAAAATGQTFVINAAMTKADGAKGKVEYDLTFPASAVGTVYLEVVRVDTTTDASGTPSGKLEYVAEAPWVATVHASAGTA